MHTNNFCPICDDELVGEYGHLCLKCQKEFDESNANDIDETWEAFCEGLPC